MTANAVRTPLVTTNTLMAISLPQDGKTALEDVIRGLGMDPLSIGQHEQTEIGIRLSEMVRKDPPWTRSYISNILRGHQAASPKFVDACYRLGALMDGTHADLAKAVKVSVMALGDVKPGALILGDSRRCANPGCPVEFVPRVPWQQCHSAECARAWRRARAAITNGGK